MVPDMRNAGGRKDEVDPVRHLIGTASLWGLNPDKEAVYLNVTPTKNDGKTIYNLTVPDTVPVNAFWSVIVYDATGHLQKNQYNAYSFNSITAGKNADGSVAIQFGGCDGKIPNCLPIMQGWNVSVAARPFRLFVRRLGSTVRRVIFGKGAHNGRPFGRHKTTVPTYRSVCWRRSKALAGRFEGTDCRGKPRAGGDCHRCRASPWVPAPAGARLAAPGAFGPVGTAGFGGHAVVRAGSIGIGAIGGRRAHRVAGSSRCDG
jgi:hypothetical protein